MALTLKELQERHGEHIGTLVLFYGELVLLIDIEEHPEDFYFVIWHPINGQVYYSVLMWMVKLKGRVSEEDYEHMVRNWNLNNPTHKL